MIKKYKHDNDPDLLPLKLKMNPALLNIVDKYAKFNPNSSGPVLQLQVYTLPVTIWPLDL